MGALRAPTGSANLDRERIAQRRSDANLVLVHYDDLRADLDGEMRRFADRLGIAVADLAPPDLVTWLHRDAR